MDLKRYRDGSAPDGWAEQLDQGIEDADRGRVYPLADVIAEVDVTIDGMTSENPPQVGHGDRLSNRTKANRRAKS